jgi:hypothetical protein
VVRIHNGLLLSYSEGNYIICRKIGGIKDHYVKWNKPESERQMVCFPSDEESSLKYRHESRRGPWEGVNGGGGGKREGH